MAKFYNKAVILSVLLWFCVWAGYNTGIERVLSPQFPHGLLDLFHGLRAFLPIVLALVLTCLLMAKSYGHENGFIKTPPGLFVAYTAVGIAASLFFSHDIKIALYWGLMYASVLAVLYFVSRQKGCLDNLEKIIKFNWAVSGIIAIGLLFFFLIQPSAPSSLTANMFICASRPYETLANVPATIDTFGMAGARPTGMSRYAAIAAIVALSYLLYAQGRKKFLWLITFLVFLAILFFAKGKTEIVSFIFAMGLMFVLAKKIKILPITSFLLVSLVSVVLIMYQIPCSNSFGMIIEPVSKIFVMKNANNGNEKIGSAGAIAKRPEIDNLSGRTERVWPEGWKLFLRSPLVGWGFHADRIFLNGTHMHNTWIQALDQAGLMGFIALMWAFASAFFLSLRNYYVANKDKNFFLGMIGVFAFFSVMSIPESFAYFNANYLFLAPLVFYSYYFSKYQSKQMSQRKEINLDGNRIDLIDMDEAVQKIVSWIRAGGNTPRQVVATGMHGIIESHRHADFKYILNSSDLFLADGISLVWFAKLKGFKMDKRVCGPDLMRRLLEVSEKEGFKSYYYGDTEHTLLALRKKYPNVKADFYSPPFRELTAQEDEKIIKTINDSRPDILWVGLGLPKQERWIYSHKNQLNVPVIIGVGAAFKFLSGNVSRAPEWIGDAGFEWLWRLFMEPKRVWKRVFIDGPQFLYILFRDFYLGKRQFLKKILLAFERHILWPLELFFGPMLLGELVPYQVQGFENKIRLGNFSDGGYVIPEEILPFINVAYCYGVADHIDFEEDLIKKIRVPIRFYDHTVEKLPAENGNFYFKKQGIASKKYADFDTFESHVNENNDKNKKILLKMDIEGFEWDVLEKIVEDFGNDITCLVVEMHHLYRYDKFRKYAGVLRKINSRFALVHIHGNNNSKPVFVRGKYLPSDLELTFINNALVTNKKPLDEPLPSKLDYRNIKEKDDIAIDFWLKRL